MGIPTFSATTATDTIAAALGDAGCVVVTGVFDESTRNRVRQELGPYMERVSVEEDDPAEFYAGLTRRTSALVARSQTVGELVVDEMSEKNISLVSVANTIASYKFLSNDSKLIISKSKKKEKKNVILKNLFSNLFYKSEVSKIIKKENPSLVHVHGLWRPIHLFFILHCVLLNKPIVIQPHGMLLEQALRSKSILNYF